MLTGVVILCVNFKIKQLKPNLLSCRLKCWIITSMKTILTFIMNHVCDTDTPENYFGQKVTATLKSLLLSMRLWTNFNLVSYPPWVHRFHIFWISFSFVGFEIESVVKIQIDNHNWALLIHGKNRVTAALSLEDRLKDYSSLQY